MKITLRIGKILKIFFLTIVILIVGAIAALYTIDFNEYRDDISSKVFRLTGRPLNIKGDLKLKLFTLYPAIVINDVHFKNMRTGTQENMVSVKKVEAVIALRYLFLGKLVVKHLVLLNPEILLETDKTGRGNWQFEFDKEKPVVEAEAVEREPYEEKTDIVEDQKEEKVKPLKEEKKEDIALGFGVKVIRVSSANFTYRDGQTGDEQKIHIKKIIANAKSLDDPINFKMDAFYNEVVHSISAKMGSVNEIMNQTQPYPIVAKIKMNGMAVGLQGNIDDVKAFKGLNLDTTVDIPSIQKTAQEYGSSAPKLPAIKMTTKVSDAGRSYFMKNLKIVMGNSHINGDVRITTGGDVPYVKARFVSPLVDFSQLNKGKKGKKEKTVEATPDDSEESEERVTEKESEEEPKEITPVFSSKRLPLEAFHVADLDVRFDIERLKLTNGLPMDNVKATLILDNGAMALSPLSADVAGGDVVGDIQLDANTTKLKMGVYLDAKKIVAGEIVEYFTEPGLLEEGMSSVLIDVYGRGETMSEVAGSLSGQVKIQSGMAESRGLGEHLFGKDIVSSMLKSKESDKRAEVYCAVLNLDFEDGIAKSERKIALETKAVNIVANGLVDLKREWLDLNLIPTAQKGLGVGTGAFVKMVKLKGHMKDLKISIDGGEIAKTAVTTALAAGAAAVATGGLSLAAGAAGLAVKNLFSRITEDTNPCRTALEGPSDEDEMEDEGPPPIQHTIQEEVGKAKEKVTEEVIEGKDKIEKEVGEEVDKAKETIGDTFKKLF